jgi:hypothetical protein
VEAKKNMSEEKFFAIGSGNIFVDLEFSEEEAAEVTCGYVLRTSATAGAVKLSD